LKGPIGPKPSGAGAALARADAKSGNCPSGFQPSLPSNCARLCALRRCSVIHRRTCSSVAGPYSFSSAPRILYMPSPFVGTRNRTKSRTCRCFSVPPLRPAPFSKSPALNLNPNPNPNPNLNPNPNPNPNLNPNPNPNPNHNTNPNPNPNITTNSNNNPNP